MTFDQVITLVPDQGLALGPSRSSAHPRPNSCKPTPVTAPRGSLWRRRTAGSNWQDEVEVALMHLPAVDPDARAILVRIAYDRGDAEAVESLLMPDHDGNPILEVFRGRMALVHGDLRSAVRHFRTGLAADPHDPLKLFMLGEALVKAGDTAVGRFYLQSARDHQLLYELIERASERVGPTRSGGFEEPWSHLSACRPDPRSQGMV